MSIFDMSTYYTELHAKLTEWAVDSSPLLDGTARPFSSAKVSLLDPVLNRLLETHEQTDTMCLEILQVLCSTFSSFTSRLLIDHLPGGKFHKPSAALEVEACSVPSTNAVSERDFAQLDRLLWEKPNASVLALEGMTAFANNKTLTWLKAKGESERQAILSTARQSAADMRDLYKMRQEEVRQY